MTDFYCDNEAELFNKVFVLQEGCFLYLRDEKMSQSPNFLAFVENAIKGSMTRNKNSKLWLIRNDALQETTKFELKVAFTEITPEDILPVISEDEFGLGFLCLVSSPTMEVETASKLWLKLVQYEFGLGFLCLVSSPTMEVETASKLWLKLMECKLGNLSPDSTEFGLWETFSITGDSNILVWTNCCLSKKEIGRIALDSDFQALDDEISMQVYSSK
uniref:Uncharacterized protein n=1 Tax=Panagrolaimus sp. JU765 TaxID=591449 RepID=A0AC34R3Q8_9BILA